MKSNLEQNEQHPSSQNALAEPIPASKGYGLKVAELVEAQAAFPDIDNGFLVEEAGGDAFNSGIWRQQVVEKRRLPSPTTWSSLVLLGDSILLISSLTIIMAIHTRLSFSYEASSSWASRFTWIALALVAWGMSSSITQTQNISRISNRFRSLLSIVCVLVLTFTFWTALSYPFIGGDVFSYIKIVVLFFPFEMLIFGVWRVYLALLINTPRFRRQAVVVGVTTNGKALVKELQLSKQPFANIVGYVGETADDSDSDEELPILGGRNELRQMLQQGVIDTIIMALDYKADHELFQEIIEMTQLGITVLPMAQVYESTSGKTPVEHVGEQWYTLLPLEHSVGPFYLCWRKVLDVSFGLLGSLVMLLLLPFLAALIYFDSPGPIFYSQERLGYQGKKFRMLKFRSMRTDAEQPGKAIWAAKMDTRVTKIGRFLRSTHLDELPQVLNILRGDMSVIGPRPERKEFVIDLEKSVPFYRSRLGVKPGLTGWAQVKCPYASSSRDTLVKLQYDLYYIKHQSFNLDIFILLKTAVDVLFLTGR